jgi:Kef-type K+ transport system membrane component KefB
MTLSNTFGTNCYDYPWLGFWLGFQEDGQPTVIGEIIAGIVLGPSLLNVFSWFFCFVSVESLGI